MVHAIERDDYSSMPARVFVRGYIKNYARVVGLPADSLLKQLEEQFPDEAAKNGLNRVGTDIRRELRSSNGFVRLITWIIVLGLGVLFVLWWRGHLDLRLQIDKSATEFTEDAAATAALPGGDGMLALPGVYSGESPVLADRQEVTESSLGELDESAPARDVAVGQVPAAPVEPGSTSTADSALVTAVEPAVQVAAEATTTAIPDVARPLTRATEGAPATGAVDPAPTSGDGKVVIAFSEPCWVDIRDSARQFKLYGEMAGGRKEVLGGVPPYKLVIGNARAATLSIDGKPFDLAEHTSGNVARFTLTAD
jgi:cytoskeleton protein RodZ